MSTKTVYESLKQANNSVPVWARPCYLCAPHGHHWYLWFPDHDGFEAEGNPEEVLDERSLEDDAEEEIFHDPNRHLDLAEEPDDAVGCICKHCPAKVYVSIDADDLPEI